MQETDSRVTHPTIDVRVFEEVLPGSLFERLARGVRSIGDERLGKNYGTTFWYPLDMVPRNVAEETIVQLIPLVGPPPGCVGIEWWLGRLDYGQKLRFHFDRDMSLMKKSGQLLHPLFGSILYLNTFPASPTVILDQVSGPDGKSCIPEKPGSREAVDAVANRYVVFPGNLRHGVRSNVDKQAPAPAERRLTLLVNYWEQRPMPPVCTDYDGKVYAGLCSPNVHSNQTSFSRANVI